DIAGWDFFDDDNDPLDSSSYFQAGNHGTGRANDAAQEGNDGQGSIGVCPRCRIMPLRIWDTFVSDANTFAQGILYATDNGAQVIEGANGSLYHSAFSEAASEYAYDHGAVQTYSGDDLNTGNHNYPANYGHAMLIEGTVPDSVGLGMDCPGDNKPPDQFKPLVDAVCGFPGQFNLGTNVLPGTFFRGANTTQFGGKSSISMEGATGSINTGRAAGGAGLVVSAALAANILLSPDEVRTILEQTAEDVTQGNTGGAGTPDPAQPGWDTHFGYGRANLGAAVSAAKDPAKIPFQAMIDSPDWYAPLTADTLEVKGRAAAPRAPGQQFHYKLEWGPGLAPRDAQWQPVSDFTTTAPVTNLGSIDLDAVRAALRDPANQIANNADPGGPVFAPNGHNPYQQQFVVRLTVTDPMNANRLPGVDRRAFTALDPVAEGLRPGFPKRLGTGGEAPLRYADLNGDNVQELIVPAEDGVIHAYEPNGDEAPGWPVRTVVMWQAEDHLQAPGMAALVAGGTPPREPPRGPAVADIDDDGKPEVIATAGTHLYVWEGDGSVRPGFPVESDFDFCDPALQKQDTSHPKCGFLASPAVADLDGDGRRSDIVVAALDGHVYAFKSNGAPVAGYPELLQDENEPAADRVLAESINQVAVGDLNGDKVDDIVAGSNETYGASSGDDVSFGGILGQASGKSTRVYALDGKVGEPLPGWPISIGALIPDVLPLIGPGADPAILNVGGQPKVLASATSGSLATYDPDGAINTNMRQETYSAGSNAVDRTPALNLFESASIGKLATDAPAPSVVKYEISAAAAANLLLVGQNFPYNHLIGAWDSATGTTAPAYPTITDDFQFLSSSTIAKVDPTGPTNQILAGTGLGLIHAYDGATGLDAPGFPKTTGGWLFSPAALSDDGRMAGITREGFLFEWTSTAAACQTEWPTFRHDPQNSGNYDRDGTPPAAPGDASLTSLGGDRYRLSFKSPGDDGFCGDPATYRGAEKPADVHGGDTVTTELTLTAGSLLRVQATDEAGNVGQPAELTVPAAVPPSAPGEQTPGAGGPAGGGNPGTPGNPGNPGTGNPGVCAAGTTVPRSSISHRHRKATRRRLALSGRSIVVDCSTGKLATGKVKRVRVSVARRQSARRCRFLRAGGRLGTRRTCAKPSYLNARVRSKRGSRNKTLWTLKLRVRLPRGRYVATVRGVDATGRRETIARATNTLTFRIR
ncbi:MAG: hypothetical protein QOJ57_122, partial [Thermoleophilaceae bacterium]|nr:hypothetical protein [Thermoleophilaceae bacterium]